MIETVNDATCAAVSHASADRGPDAGRDDDAQRIRDAYAVRDSSSKRQLYSPFREDYRLETFRKASRWSHALVDASMKNLGDLDILDVGCGSGGWLRMLMEWGADPRRLHGVDLLEDRIARARSMSPSEMDLRCCSAWPLPYEDATMDIVAASTVFSSILDAEARRRLSDDMSRVLRPRGRIMIYDFIVSHPRNPDTIGIGGREVRRLFPALVMERAYPLTLAPPLARRIAPWSCWIAHMLESMLPILCTHRLFVLQKPETAASEKPGDAKRPAA